MTPGMKQFDPTSVPALAPGAPAPLVLGNQFSGRLGDLLVSAIIAEGDTHKMLELAINPDILHAPEKPRYQFLLDFVRKHGALPTLEAYVRDTGYTDLPKATEPATYYAEKLRDRYTRDGTTQALLTLSQQLKTPNLSSTEILSTAVSNLLTIKQGAVSQGIYDLRQIEQRLVPAYTHRMMHEDEATVFLGWDYMDKNNSGATNGDIISVVGRPAMGKTWMMLHMALTPWLLQHKRTMFVTTEMTRAQIDIRFAAMLARVPVKGLTKSTLATPQYDHLRGRLLEISTYEAPLWIVDAQMGCTVQDLWSLCSQLGVEWLVIDGAYLLRHPNPKLDRFTRVAENCRLFKSELASDLNIPLAASWQFNREMSKKKNSKGKKGGDEKPTVDDIGFSDEVGQISSIVLGLLEADSIETMMRRRVDLLKGRGGEVGGFYINWDFINMDFSECRPLTHDSLKFI